MKGNSTADPVVGPAESPDPKWPTPIPKRITHPVESRPSKRQGEAGDICKGTTEGEVTIYEYVSVDQDWAG